MTLSNILLQVMPAMTDTVSATKLKALTDSVKTRVGTITDTFTNPDSLVNLTPSKVASSIKNFDWSGVITSLSTQVISLTFRVLAAILIFYVGKFIINKIYNIVRTMLIKKDVERSLGTFLLSFIKFTLLFLLIIIVIGVIGIETSSFIAIFASAGIAIGMALSGTLQNFAGGVLILLIKPYKIGDYIEFGEFKGYVKEIQIFHTILTTYNNDKIVIPNGGLSTGTINNFSAEKIHRLEWRVSISYGDNVETARNVILEIIKNDNRLLKPDSKIEDSLENSSSELNKDKEDKNKDKGSLLNRIFHWTKKKDNDWHEAKTDTLDKMPKRDYTPIVALEKMSDSAIVLIVRAWCKVEDYWNTLYDINEKIYNTLPQNNVHFPFPQIDVHVKN